MLGCLLALTLSMAVEVQHEFVVVKTLDARLAARLNDGWEVVFSSFLSSNPGQKNEDARMLFVFKKGTP